MFEKLCYVILLVWLVIILKEREGEIELDIYIYVVNCRFCFGNFI